MGHVPPTPDLYFPECVSHAHSFVHPRVAMCTERAPPCGHVLTDPDLNSPSHLVLPVHGDLATVPGYDCWTFIWGELSLSAWQLEGWR